MKTVGRDKIRRKKLEPYCYRAHTYRPEDEDENESMYVFCRGHNLEECHKCEAFMPHEDTDFPFAPM